MSGSCPVLDAVFLDRDGTVIEDAHYLRDPALVRLLPGAGPALKALADAGMRLFLVTNQSGVGRGMFTEKDVLACHARLKELLAGHGVAFTDWAYCPHAPEAGCDCRKPGPGMWRALRAEHGLYPARCAMVGDKLEDVRFGLDLGFAVTVLVMTGKGENHAARLGLAETELPGPDRPLVVLDERKPEQPHALALDIAAACAWLKTGAFAS